MKSKNSIYFLNPNFRIPHNTDSKFHLSRYYYPMIANSNNRRQLTIYMILIIIFIKFDFVDKKKQNRNLFKMGANCVITTNIQFLLLK